MSYRNFVTWFKVKQKAIIWEQNILEASYDNSLINKTSANLLTQILLHFFFYVDEEVYGGG